MAPLSADEAARRALSLKLLLFDVDGVLTDGGLILTAGGSESKRFDIKDGAALVWAQRAGLLTGVLSGRASKATEIRSADLGITVVVLGRADKRAGYDEILESRGLTDAEVGYMGDDLMDLPVLLRAGLSAAPADACTDVRSRVHWVASAAGGRGAAREFIEFVLRARGQWDALLGSYIA